MRNQPACAIPSLMFTSRLDKKCVSRQGHSRALLGLYFGQTNG